ncbi:MAG: 3-isopropylmalate dehydratase small subunit [Actinobacteria bacterium]|jgi:3-isopropylmalate/(R)-2-methylmalate dehydratase small subunit|nr:3-isopropylmalate dehydratase small subunit [Actinomycetota bacterium]MBT5655397.1 3-isopropylmalate dehydratase small subunit [Actinomycetota bacterium]MBT7013797.1 3-isopropylmalate dehydratase small subunit [Actinomycetota bacterium]MDA9607961.1 3-isopropylmalate dehydratase small subunit [Candidatus Actinomarina sp.]
MKKLNNFVSTMLPLPMSNIDTDQIMPKQFLKRVERSGYGQYLFHDWKKEEGFPLNNPAYSNAKVLLAGTNFGTGSSREHAPWGLQDWGFDAIISSKFADIFKLNSINIGLVPIETTEENMDILFDKVNLNSNVEINISINEKKVTCEELEFDFVIDNFSQNRILNGIDKIDISLDYSNMIEEFKENRSTWMPKLTD